MSKPKYPARMTAEEFRNRGLDPRRTVRRSGEHDNQAAYFQILEMNTRDHPELQYIFAVPNAAKRSPKVIHEMKAEGLKSGVPDIMIPIARHGHGGAWIENKFGDNKMSPTQISYRDFLLSQNYTYSTSYSLKNSLDFTEWYLGIELRRPA